MPTIDEFDLFIEQLLENAVREFKSTEQYKLLQEKLDKMDSDCDTMLTEDEKTFAVECFALLLQVHGQEELHVYRRGLQDGVKILKWLGALA